MTNLPKLFKKTVTGAIQTWEVSVSGNEITATFGQLNGKLTVAKEIIRAGKNIGKINETSPSEQAELEAQASWEGKMKKGYVTSVDSASENKVDAAFIEGGSLPMLAQTPEKLKTPMGYPVAVQPKLDGHRCLAVVADGKCTLWSRTRKPIHSLPHIVAAIEALRLSDVVLDGELYNHDYKTRFEELTSLIRSQAPQEGCDVVQYHIYDVIDCQSMFTARHAFIQSLASKMSHPLVAVATIFSQSDEEVKAAAAAFVLDGYEGAMVRNPRMNYEQKRSMSLVKLKEFQDAEFVVVGVDEGSGRLAGHVGSFILKTSDGKTFNAKLVGELSQLAAMWSVRDSFIGRQMTVKFQGFTSDGIPRFPVAMRLLSEEIGTA